MENTAWAGCTISNNDVVGLVIAVGKDTRLEKNSSTSKGIKKTQLDKKINMFSIILFLLMSLMSFINAIAAGSAQHGFSFFMITVMRFIVLLSFLIPISVKLYLMIGRFGFS